MNCMHELQHQWFCEDRLSSVDLHLVTDWQNMCAGFAESYHPAP